jgi:hypothetical protein
MTSTTANGTANLAFATRAGTSDTSLTERMRISVNGNVGINTTSSSYKLMVSDNSAVSPYHFWVDNNFGTASDIVESTIVMGGRDYVRPWARISGRQVTSGSYASGEMRFYTYDSDAAHTTPDMVLQQNGYLLIGYTTSNGAYRLQVNSQIFATNATIATSDGRYKENISPINSGLDIVNKLNPVSFTWKQHEIHNFDSGTQIGFIAQDIQKTLADAPFLKSLVKRNVIELKDGNKEEFLGLSDTKLIPILVKAIQELKAEIDILKQKQ